MMMKTIVLALALSCATATTAPAAKAPSSSSGTLRGLNVLVFGDSQGDTGPTYQALQDAFDLHSVSANVVNAAVGGTLACGWLDDGGASAIADAARDAFGTRAAPDVVWCVLSLTFRACARFFYRLAWVSTTARGRCRQHDKNAPSFDTAPHASRYTAGGNDFAGDELYHLCLSRAADDDAAAACVAGANDRMIGCTQALFEGLWAEFPDAKVGRPAGRVRSGSVRVGSGFRVGFSSVSGQDSALGSVLVRFGDGVSCWVRFGSGFGSGFSVGSRSGFRGGFGSVRCPDTQGRRSSTVGAAMKQSAQTASRVVHFRRSGSTTTWRRTLTKTAKRRTASRRVPRGGVW